MPREYLDKMEGHEVWTENGIVYCSSKVIELTQEHVDWIFGVLRKHFATTKGKRNLVMLFLKGIVSVSAERNKSRIELTRMDVEKLAIVVGRSRIATLVMNFVMRVTPQGKMKTKLFENESEAKKWLLEP